MPLAIRFLLKVRYFVNKKMTGLLQKYTISEIQAHKDKFSASFATLAGSGRICINSFLILKNSVGL